MLSGCKKRVPLIILRPATVGVSVVSGPRRKTDSLRVYLIFVLHLSNVYLFLKARTSSFVAALDAVSISTVLLVSSSSLKAIVSLSLCQSRRVRRRFS
jgi:hypothetical protein